MSKNSQRTKTKGTQYKKGLEHGTKGKPYNMGYSGCIPYNSGWHKGIKIHRLNRLLMALRNNSIEDKE